MQLPACRACRDPGNPDVGGGALCGLETCSNWAAKKLEGTLLFHTISDRPSKQTQNYEVRNPPQKYNPRPPSTRTSICSADGSTRGRLASNPVFGAGYPAGAG